VSQTRWQQVQDIFWHARSLPAAEREAYLVGACADNAQLLSEVRGMLAADTGSGLLDHAPAIFQPDMSGADAVNDRIGPYVIEEEIGRGAMGIVYRAYDPRLQRDVALKFLNPRADRDPAANARFLTEARTASSLDHPHHCPVYDIGTADDGRLYIAMAYCAGGSLADRLTAGPLPIQHAIDVTIAVAEALHHAHEAGIVHRDVKPANIAFTERGAARVLDFGVAVLGEQDSSGGQAGTPYYMAPEQIRRQPADRRSDVWALGVVLYEMLAGRKPFAGDDRTTLHNRILNDTLQDIRRERAEVSDEVARVLARALAKDPAQRFPTAAAFATELRLARSSLGRRRTQRYATAAVVAALTIFTGYFSLYRSRSTVSESVIDEQKVAVLPFHASGDASIGYLREGMMDLLAAKFTGEGGLQAADPRAVYAKLRNMPNASRELTSDDALALARDLGAGHVLTGNIVSAGSNLIVNASVLNAKGTVVSRASAQGTSEELGTIVDRLVAELLSLTAGEEPQRLDALTSTSLPALRAYLEGQAAYRRGRYAEAVEKFNQAVDFDSTFALAGLGMELADGWAGTGHGRQRGRAIAWRSRDRLSARDRALLEASVGPNYPRAATMTERLDATERALRIAPDRVELWYMLGDLYFHYGRIFGATDWEARAERGLRQAIELDAEFAGPKQHLVQLYARQGRNADLLAVATDALTREPKSAAADYIRWRMSLALRNRSANDAPSLDSLGNETLGWIAINTQDDGFAIDVGRRAARVRAARIGTREQRFERILSLHAAALNGGRPLEAVLIADSLRAVQADTMFDKRLLVLAALYGGGDRAAGERAAQALSNSGAQLDRCVAAQWRWFQHRDVPLAMNATREATVAERVCSAALEALRTSVSGDAERALGELTELYRSAPVEFYVDSHVEYAPIVHARILESQGKRDAALAALRSRPYFIGWQPLVSASLREEGRLAAQVGDREGAIRAYRHFLALRPNPEPALRPINTTVQNELAKLIARR
jgi:serine/threonine-protein kinase